MNSDASDVTEPDLMDPPSVRSRLLGGSFWTLMGYGFQQLLRFGHNLVLTRLLVPEAFGLMSLTQVFMSGLEMLSDVGIGASIIQGKHGDDPRFLRTAWSLQLLRGFILSAVAAVLAWPIARFYGKPELLLMIPVTGLGMILRGLTSVRYYTLNRKVRLERLTVLEILSQVLSVGLTIAAASYWHSVWALVAGWLTGSAARVILSHCFLPGPADGLAWDRAALGELVRVGRWIFLGTAATFFAGRLDMLVMGRLLTAGELGVYSTAMLLATAFPMVADTLGSRVVFPLLSETHRQEPARLRGRLRKIRFLWISLFGVILAILSLLGEPLVHLLYPNRFHDAGWMLRILAAGLIAWTVNKATGVVWLALGDFRMNTILMLIRIPALIGAMLGGDAVAGLRGVVAGVALVEFVMYPIQTFIARRRGLWQPEIDVPALAVAGSLFLLAYRG